MKTKRFVPLFAAAIIAIGYSGSASASCGCNTDGTKDVTVTIGGFSSATFSSSVDSIVLNLEKPIGTLKVKMESGQDKIAVSGGFDPWPSVCDTAGISMTGCGLTFSPGGDKFSKGWQYEKEGDLSGSIDPFTVTVIAEGQNGRDGEQSGNPSSGNPSGTGGFTSGEAGGGSSGTGQTSYTQITPGTGGGSVTKHTEPFAVLSRIPLGYDTVADAGNFQSMGNLKFYYHMGSTKPVINHFSVASVGFDDAGPTNPSNKVHWYSASGSPRILVSPEGALRLEEISTGVKAEMFPRAAYNATLGTINTGAAATSTYLFESNTGGTAVTVKGWIRKAATGDPTSLEEYELDGTNTFVESKNGIRTTTTVVDELAGVTLTGVASTDDPAIRGADRIVTREVADLTVAGEPVVSRTIETFAYIPERTWNWGASPPTLGTTITNIRQVRKSLHHDFDGDQTVDAGEVAESWEYYGERTSGAGALTAANYGLLGTLKYHSGADGNWTLYGYGSTGSGVAEESMYRPWGNTAEPNLSLVGIVDGTAVPAGISGAVKQTLRYTYISYETVDTVTTESYINGSVVVALSEPSGSEPSLARTEIHTKEYNGTWTPAAGNAWTEFSDVTPAKPHRMVVTTYGTKDFDADYQYQSEGNFRVVPFQSKQIIEIYGQSGLLVRETRLLTDWLGEIVTEADFEPATRDAFTYDSQYRLIEVKRDGRTVSTVQYPSDLERIETDEQGIATLSRRDARGRVISQTVLGGGGVGDVTTSYEYLGLETRTRINGQLIARSGTDMAGRSTFEEDQTGGLTTWAYADQGRTVTVTKPDTGTEITSYLRDGKLASVTGTGVVARYYEYDFENASGSDKNYLVTERIGGPASNRMRVTVSDPYGKVFEVRMPNAATGAMDVLATVDPDLRRYYGVNVSMRKLSSSSATEGGSATYPAINYSKRTWGGTMGMHTFSGKVAAWNTNKPGAGGTRLAESHTYYEKDEVTGYWWQKTLLRRGPEDATSTVESLRGTRLWQGDGLQAATVSTEGETVTTTTTFDRVAKKSTQISDSNRVVGTADVMAETVNGYTQWAQGQYSSASGHRATYTYDSLGRVTAIRDHRGAVTRKVYNSAGQMIRSIDALGRATQYAYIVPGNVGAGQVGTITRPDGKTSVYTYTLLGQIASIGGTAEYPQSFTYNAYGEKETMTTTNAAGSSVTRWEYNSAGLLKTKYYNWSTGYTSTTDGAVNHTYDAFGRLLEKSIAGGKTTSYTYNKFDEIETIDYGDDGAADVTLVRNAAGSVAGVSESFEDADGTTIGSGTTTYTYAGGRLDEVIHSLGHSYLPNVKLDYKTLDAAGRPEGYEVKRGGTTDLNVTYAYDGQGRLASAGSVQHGTATYSYHPGSGVVAGYTINSSGAVLTQTRPVDFQNRVSSVTTRNGSNQILATVAYSYDMADRRTQARREDGSYWNYGYNSRGEVTGATRHTPSGLSIDGLERQYNYDDIGNRIWAKSGGGENGALSQSDYTVNGHNQYTGITHPGKTWVVGRAPTLDDVYVNTQLATRQETWFSKELSVANSTTPVKQSVLVQDDLGGTIQSGNLEIPKANNSPVQYDKAGNLANDGWWEYKWDSENRLRKMTSIGSVFTSQTVEFVYDWQGKRIAKKVTEGSTVRHTRYLYEDWNVAAEWTLHGSSTTLNTPQTYLWGLDLVGQQSGNIGQLQAASGVGGLLAADVRKVSDATAAGKVYASYDGNGNILAWSDASGSVKRTQEYDAFGNVVLKNTASSGVLSAGNGEVAYGFSTKPEESESALLYYGYRFYDPVTGRWPSRDPIEERGGVNLYGFSHNDGLNKWDAFGLIPFHIIPDLWRALTSCENGKAYLDDPKIEVTVPGKVDVPDGIKGLGGLLANRAEQAQAAEAGIVTMFSSIGLEFNVDISLTYKCCNCKSKTKERKLGPERVDGPLGVWTTKPDISKDLFRTVRDAVDSMKDEAIEDCKQYADKNE